MKEATFDEQGLRTDVHLGDVVEGCNFHIGKVIEVDPTSDWMLFQSMFDGQDYSCSLYNCGVIVLDDVDVKQRQEAYMKGGMAALAAALAAAYQEEEEKNNMYLAADAIGVYDPDAKTWIPLIQTEREAKGVAAELELLVLSEPLPDTPEARRIEVLTTLLNKFGTYKLKEEKKE